jgi:L-asparaginase / beta-aspartyl-peptidase
MSDTIMHTNRYRIFRFIRILMIFVSLIPYIACEMERGSRNAGFGLVIHGGAGNIKRENLTPELDAGYREALTAALEAGFRILDNGGSSLDAVEAVVRILEDDSLFNAGRGAVFTAEGTNELDAAIMDGNTLDAGAVAGVTRIKNPVTLARRIMEESEHVMLAREGAEKFGEHHGIDIVPEKYFYTERRWEALQRVREREAESDNIGTVGAVALDSNGNLAAATSTGGMTNKRFGRVGDVPVIGAGTYANNATCAVSATGHGEYFIRSVVAYDISALMEYRGLSLHAAAERVITEKVPALGGYGGVIAIDRDGNIAMPFNTAGMYRGYVLDDGEIVVKLYGDE